MHSLSHTLSHAHSLSHSHTLFLIWTRSLKCNRNQSKFLSHHMIKISRATEKWQNWKWNQKKFYLFLLVFFLSFPLSHFYSIHLFFFLFLITAHRSGSPPRSGSQNVGSCDSSELHVSADLFIRNRSMMSSFTVCVFFTEFL